MSNNKGMSARELLVAARLFAAQKAPYLVEALLALVPREVPLGTITSPGPNGEEPTGTIGVTADMILVYEAKALETWTTPQAGAALLHEVLHVLRDTHGRQKENGYDPRLFNIADDAAINDDLVAMGLELPGQAVLPASIDCPNGLLGEEYYERMRQRILDNPPQHGRAKYVLQDMRDQKSGGSGDEHCPPTPGSGHCGGCAGHRHKNEEESDGQGEGRSPAERAAIAASVAEEIQKEAQLGRGTVPAGLARWAETLKRPPKIPWQKQLAKIARASLGYRPGAVDYRFSRVSRRQAGVGFGPGRPVLPALISPVPNVVVALDTSGSMGTETIQSAVVEIEGILKAVGARVTFISCDAAIGGMKKIDNPRQLASLIVGGGGTDFRPVFEEVARMRPAPDMLAFFTDGDGPAPSLPPAMRVLWVLMGPHRCKPHAGDYGSGGSVTYGAFVEVD